MSQPLCMSISLNVLKHLGINLYSSTPAVLSEIVANAWDADATCVKVVFDPEENQITIQDDGIGMSRADVVDHFLKIGFQRRDAIGDKTSKGRLPMGRKGIGKLSMFSIAGSAEIHTISKGEYTAFLMNKYKIEEAAEKEVDYEPEELSDHLEDLEAGTKIILKDISKSITKMSEDSLRKRIARRFSVIGPSHGFQIYVNGREISPEDRGYHKFLQYLWTYEDQSDFVNLCQVDRHEQRLSEIQGRLQEEGISLTGWIGTVRRPSQLRDEANDNLHQLAVFMRGKLAHEDLLHDFAQKEIYAEYVVGELHCDELDDTNQDDIATTSRQSLKEDDPRFKGLREIVRSELRHIAGCWTSWRTKDGARESAQQVAAVNDWLDCLRGDTKKKAEKWIGRLNTIKTDDHEKRELLKSSILAFEHYRRKESLDALENVSDLGLSDVLKIFNDVDDLELSYYGQITKGRLDVIRALQHGVEENMKEKIIQKHLFNHLWLLDPSWERTIGSEVFEKSISTFLEEDTQNLPEELRKNRIDIGYRTNAGKHVIIELKRPEVTVKFEQLLPQIMKYQEGVLQLLSKKDPDANPPIEIICVLGSNLQVLDPGAVANALKSLNIRIVLYSQLLENARAAYQDYLEKHAKLDRLWGIFEAIDNFSPTEE